MINDDLPTNMDYLDESFGAAAGLREIDDDDLDEFDANEVPAGAPVDIASDGTGIISSVGGETIKMLKPEGIRVVDDYFDTLPPDSGAGGDE
jgi:autophagy-related protein 2